MSNDLITMCRLGAAMRAILILFITTNFVFRHQAETEGGTENNRQHQMLIFGANEHSTTEPYYLFAPIYTHARTHAERTRYNKRSEGQTSGELSRQPSPRPHQNSAHQPRHLAALYLQVEDGRHVVTLVCMSTYRIYSCVYFINIIFIIYIVYVRWPVWPGKESDPAG